MKNELKLSPAMYEFLRNCKEDSKEVFEKEEIDTTVFLSVLLSDSSNALAQYLFDDFGIIHEEIDYFFFSDFVRKKEKKSDKSKNDKKVVRPKKENSKKEEVVTVNIVNKKSKKSSSIKIEEKSLEIIQYSFKLQKEYGKDLKEDDTLMFFVIAFVEKMPPEFNRFFRKIDISSKDLKEEFSLQNQVDSLIIPKKMKNFLRDLNKDIDTSKPCEILGRENETEKLWNILLKRDKSNGILVGKPGVGKTAIIEKIAYQIVNETCPKEFYGYHVIAVSVNSIIAGTTYRGEAEENFEDLIKYIEKNDKIILFFDEIHTILGAGACKEGEMDLANSLKPILSRGTSKVVGATTEEEYEKYFSKDGALKRRFKKIFVYEPENDEVYNLIKNRISALEAYHNVSISKKMVDYAILMASCFDYETANPDRTIDLIDVSMAKAKKDGRSKVMKDDILAVYNMDIERFKKMSDYDKKAIAYHEAGHFIVRRFSPNIKDSEVIAISIIPADDALGINAINFKKCVQTLRTKSYFLETMSVYMGGRIAEKIFTSELSSGAWGDLEQASSTAEEYLLAYGFDEDNFKNQYLLKESNQLVEYFSEKQKENIENKKKELISDAYNRAEGIINQNIPLLEKLVSELLENHILSKVELDKIFDEYLQSINTLSDDIIS